MRESEEREQEVAQHGDRFTVGVLEDGRVEVRRHAGRPLVDDVATSPAGDVVGEAEELAPSAVSVGAPNPERGIAGRERHDRWANATSAIVADGRETAFPRAA